MSYTIGVVGSRSFTDRGQMEQVPFLLADLVVSGGADGADTLAEEMCWDYEVPTRVFLPEDTGLPKPQAYWARNQQIVDAADELWVFYGPGEGGPDSLGGSNDTLRRAREKRIPIHLYYQ